MIPLRIRNLQAGAVGAAMSNQIRKTPDEHIDDESLSTFAEKWRRIGELWAMTRSFHAAAERLRSPAASNCEVHREWLLFNVGERVLNEIVASGHDIYQGLP